MIDSYRFGEIVVDGVKYTSDVLIFSGRVKASWWRKRGHELGPEDLGEALAERPEVLVVGTGDLGLMSVPSETQRYLESQRIGVIIERTQEACRTYNQIAGAQRVVAALHLTC